METLQLGSTGPIVELLQSTLMKLGFFGGRTDGNFGRQTQIAVIRFQRNFGLIPDGAVGASTWDALFPYINGRTAYTIQSGDTLSGIAAKFGTTWQRIYEKNVAVIGSNPNLIYPGTKIII